MLISFLLHSYTEVRAELHGVLFSLYNLYQGFVHCIGLLLAVSAFSSLSLFVVTKSNQKRLDKKNSLRLRLRSDSFLSQRNGLVCASRLLMLALLAGL